jgi:hypothetical protein
MEQLFSGGDLFLKWGCPSLCTEEMHTQPFFISFFQQKYWQEALQRSYKRKPPTKGVKAPPN